MHIAFCSDINYLCWCVVPAITAIEKSIDCGAISIHLILSEDCRDSSLLQKFMETLDIPNVSVNIYYVNELIWCELPVSGHGSIANYFRLLIPDLLPRTIKKIIYLDCDSIVLDSLAALWETELNGAPLAAVSNMSLFESEAIRLDAPYMYGTFNSGVLIMDLDVFRKEGLHYNCMQKAREMGDKIVYWDQDVLNILARQRWLKLDNCWNVQHGYTIDPLIKAKYSVDHPKIIHFSGLGLKPWESKVLPYADEYMRRYYELGFYLPKNSSTSVIQKVKQSIKSTSKKILGKAANASLLNPSMIRALAPAYRRLANKTMVILSEKERERNIRETAEKTLEIVSQFFSVLTVSNGPFKGMMYPSAESVGSAMLPKLAGSYEIEISKMFTAEFLSQFSDFFDIGCAEGYYAIGAATIAPSLSVHAYDINSHALALCRAMANLNGVANRVDLGEKFTLAKLARVKESGKVGKCLILVDCEGAEAAIFSSESYGERWALQDCMLIIESHDFLRPGMADHIIKFFAGSHRLKRILAVGDLLRPSYCSSFIPNDCDRETASLILAEKRPAPMEWLVFEPLQSTGITWQSSVVH
jgi:lipopolysaccharide biosynthesis glycosyltransferase